MGMGVEIGQIIHQNWTIIHIGPPRTVREYIQETGRAGRDGSQSVAILYYDNYDIASNRKEMSDEIHNYCRLEGKCMRGYLLDCLDATVQARNQFRHLCCSNCKLVCQCNYCH